MKTKEEIPSPETKSTKEDNRLFAYLILFFGVYFLLKNLGILNNQVFVFLFQFWPILLIAWAIKLISK